MLSRALDRTMFYPNKYPHQNIRSKIKIQKSKNSPVAYLITIFQTSKSQFKLNFASLLYSCIYLQSAHHVGTSKDTVSALKDLIIHSNDIIKFFIS